MAYKGQKVQKVMVQPINLIFRYLQNRARVQIWLYEQVTMRIEGHIIGFDEYMNLVLDEAEEIYLKSKTRRTLECFQPFPRGSKDKDMAAMLVPQTKGPNEKS